MRNATQHCYITSMEDIFDLARYLSEPFPNARDVMIGIYELLLNAVEHGNLGMDSGVKAQLLRSGTFSKEIARRLALPHNRKKYIEIQWQKDDCFLRLSIRDQGKGFDWRQRLEGETDTRSHHGRGLLIANQCGFDALMFNEKGNCVTCLARHAAVMKPRVCNHAANIRGCEKIKCPRQFTSVW